MEKGDAVIFSSREIPGNERAIGKIQNRLLRQGIELVTVDQEPVHVSGHPARDELAQMLRWVKPRVVVPVHGELRHQMAHAEVARECGITEVVIPSNGSLVQLAPGPAEIVGEMVHGKLAIDGKRVVPLESGAMRSRHRVIFNGAAVVTVVLNERGELASAPRLSAIGLADEELDRDLLLDVVDAVREAVAALAKPARKDDHAVTQAVKAAVRRSFNASHGKKPHTDVHLIRV